MIELIFLFPDAKKIVLWLHEFDIKLFKMSSIPFYHDHDKKGLFNIVDIPTLTLRRLIRLLDSLDLSGHVITHSDMVLLFSEIEKIHRDSGGYRYLHTVLWDTLERKCRVSSKKYFYLKPDDKSFPSIKKDASREGFIKLPVKDDVVIPFNKSDLEIERNVVHCEIELTMIFSLDSRITATDAIFLDYLSQVCTKDMENRDELISYLKNRYLLGSFTSEVSKRLIMNNKVKDFVKNVFDLEI